MLLSLSLVLSLLVHHCHHHCQCHWYCHLCTAVPVTALLIETSYLADTCTYIPNICNEILGQCDIYFWNSSHFNKIRNVALLSTWLSLKPLYLAQLCIYTGATHKKKIMHLQIIFLKLWIFKKNYILHFLAHIHAKDTNPQPPLSLCTWWHTAGASGVYSFY